jgi:hypothetical protein
MTEAVYRSPQAMRQAVKDRLRRLAQDQPGTQLADLQRQFAYDRLLSRVFRVDPDQWVLKGAAAMLARLGARARHTLDIDLYGQQGNLDEAENALVQLLRSTSVTTFDSHWTRVAELCRNSVHCASRWSPTWV